MLDPITQLKPLVADFLNQRGSDEVEIDGQVEGAHWRPHVLERQPLRGWYIHDQLPEASSWAIRARRSVGAHPGLRIGVVAPIDAFFDDDFLDECDDLDASVVLIESESETWSVTTIFNSIADLICEKRLNLSPGTATKILDRRLDRALTETDTNRKGVLLELVVAVLLSQVRGFEVASIGVSNRSEQMDVLVHNRIVGGALSGSPIVLAEVKNWKDPVTPQEFNHFSAKLEARRGRAKLGFLITASRFTAGVIDTRLRDSKADNLIVLVDGPALPSLWRGGDITDAVERAAVMASMS